MILDKSKCDFSGWATKNNIECSDGRTIRKDAFKDCDGDVVPIVWNHCHKELDNVLGHGILENRDEGVYFYGFLNDAEEGRKAKLRVQHGDLNHLSIYANQLKQAGKNVMHGIIREVSLVLAGANPGAVIDSVSLAHGDEYESEDEAIIYTDSVLELAHAEQVEEVLEHKEETENKTEESKEMDNKDKTIKEVIDSMSEEQQTVLYGLVGQAYEDGQNNANEEGDEDMKHNVFDTDQEELIHGFDFAEIAADAKRCGSMKEAFLAHADQFSDDTERLAAEHPAYGTYGVGEHTDYLFPDARLINNTPDMIKRDTTWVGNFLNKAHHSPFSRVKSIHANITADEARARGYVRGNYKVEEVIALIKRTTDPQTIYKKQRMDRDDVIDITSMDVVAWLKGEMRGMLDEELARACLVGDGRDSSSDDKIDPLHIRPIWTDADLYTIKANVVVPANATSDVRAKAFIRRAIKARKDYKGSGNPILYTTEDMLTDMLLLEDGIGRLLYESESKLATTLRVSAIVTVPVMEGLTRELSVGGKTVTADLQGIILNPADYNIGADNGGKLSMFDDFDIDYNQMKYLIETRCSGALTKPYSAIALECYEQPAG